MIKQLLNQALRIVQNYPVQYVQFAGNVKGTNGIVSPSYNAPISVNNASVQPLPTQLYQLLGLDMQREYRRVFVSTNALALEGQISSDKFIIDGKEWTIWGNQPWHSYDGWNELIVVGAKTR